MWWLFLVLPVADAKKPKPPPAPTPVAAERPSVEPACPPVGSVATFHLVTTRERHLPDGSVEKSASADDIRMEVVQLGEQRVHRVQYSNPTQPIPSNSPMDAAIFAALAQAPRLVFDVTTGANPQVVDPTPLVDGAREVMRIARPKI